MKRINTSRLLFFLLSLALVVPLLSGTHLGAPATGDEESDGDSFYKYLSVFTEVLRLVRQVYVEEPDIQSLMAGALDGASDALDPFSVYVPPERVQDYIAARAVGERHTGLLLLKERGVVYVASVEEGSPAAAGGLERADIISKIEGVSSRALPLWQIRQLLARDEGEELELEVVRRGESRDVTLELKRFARTPARLAPQQGVSVLRIPGFGPDTAERVAELLAGVGDGPLLVDVRGVAGGDPEAAYAVGRRFASGELGSLVERSGSSRSFSSTSPAAWKGSGLAVLVDRGTQGSAEILAAILHQGAGATMLGEETFGHAGRAAQVRLAGGGLLEITDAFYTGPDGKPLREGIEPDVEITVPFQVLTQKEEDGDPILERAVEVVLESLAPAAEAA
jgi:carboxyl-terminal processing protease